MESDAVLATPYRNSVIHKKSRLSQRRPEVKKLAVLFTMARPIKIDVVRRSNPTRKITELRRAAILVCLPLFDSTSLTIGIPIFELSAFTNC